MMEQTTVGRSAGSLRERELDVAREVALAFLTAGSPLEVYRLVLARLTPLVRATFSSVFQRDPVDTSLLKLVCAHNWPQSSARYLGQLRVRVGRGPTGRAVAEAAPVEVGDVFTDDALRTWWEPARELGFTSLISLPLRSGTHVMGALTFYFDAARTFDDDERQLLMLIADQLALTSGHVARDDAVVLARRALAAAGPPPGPVEVLLDEPVGPLPLTADGVKVVKVLGDLLAHAYRSVPGGTITLSVRRTMEGSRSMIEWTVAGGAGTLRGNEAIGDLSLGLARLLGGRVTPCQLTIPQD